MNNKSKLTVFKRSQEINFYDRRILLCKISVHEKFRVKRLLYSAESENLALKIKLQNR